MCFQVRAASGTPTDWRQLRPIPHGRRNISALNGVAPTPPVRRSASLALTQIRTFVSLHSASRATVIDRTRGATIVRRAVFGEPSALIHPRSAGLTRPATRALENINAPPATTRTAIVNNMVLSGRHSPRDGPDLPIGPLLSVRLCTSAPRSGGPTIAVRLGRGPDSWDNPQDMPPRPRPVPPTPPAFDVQAFLKLARVSSRTVRFATGAVVFAQGAQANSVFFVQEGGVKLSVLSSAGKEAVVAMLGPGDFLGEGCLAGQPLRMGTATAVMRTILLRIPKRDMVRMLHEHPAFSDRFLAHMLTRNIRIEEDLVDQLFNSSEKRLARTLLLLARYGKEDTTQRLLRSCHKRRSRKWSARRAPG